MSHQNPPDATRVSRIFFYILMFAGMLDANIDIRMLKKAGDDSES